MTKDTRVDRRSFIAGVATAGAGAATAGVVSRAPAEAAAKAPSKLTPPSTELAVAETGNPNAVFTADRWHVKDAGSDYMVDCIKHVGYKYLTCMPGSTFRGIHESFINYGMNSMPEMLSCTHEEISAAMAHGYAKMAGKPMSILVHNTVGLQHAAMGIYNAYCDRVPMMVLVGNIADAATRRPGVEWYHTATDVASMVRGFIKFDASPASLQAFGEGVQKAHAMSLTPPYGPVLVVVDADLAEGPRTETPLPMAAFSPVAPSVADPAALAVVAKMLAAAQSPVIVADRVAHTDAGMTHMVALAESLQIPVIDMFNRPNFPNNHHLFQAFSQKALVEGADVILGLDVGDLFGVVADVADLPQRTTKMKIKPGTKVLHISSMYSLEDGNYQDQQRFFQPDMALAGDSEASLPYLIDAVSRAAGPERLAQNTQREAHFRAQFAQRRASDLDAAAQGWDAQPVSVGRLCAETWNQIKGDSFSLVGGTAFESAWPQRLWTLDKHYHTNGDSGGGGVGYNLPAAVGAALAARDQGRYAVAFQGDGDFLCQSAALWTAAHHKIPLLTVMHNNRGWHQEVMHVQRIADRRERHPERAHIGTTIDDPAIDFAKVAQGYGVYAEGPVTDPAALAPALARALKVVRSGRPALVDVVSQGR